MNCSSLITVGLPVRDAMPALVETMASLFAQSTSGFEILAIVDGGNDRSLEYLESLREPRLRVISQPGRGLKYTLNRMLHECRTPWLVRQDADDVSHSFRLQKIIDAISAHSDAGMLYSLANYHPRGRAIGSFRCSRGSPDELREIVRSGYLLSICHPTVTLNVEKTLAIGGYRLGLHNEDADLWWRMALQYDIYCIPEELVGFRQSASSVSAKNLGDQVVAGLYVQYLLLSHLWRLSPRPIDEVRAPLQSLLPRHEFEAKEQLRRFNIDLAQRKYGGAFLALAGSLASSPRYVLGRMSDEWSSSRLIANGIQPARYLEHKEALWL